MISSDPRMMVRTTRIHHSSRIKVMQTILARMIISACCRRCFCLLFHTYTRWVFVSSLLFSSSVVVVSLWWNCCIWFHSLQHKYLLVLLCCCTFVPPIILIVDCCVTYAVFMSRCDYFPFPFTVTTLNHNHFNSALFWMRMENTIYPCHHCRRPPPSSLRKSPICLIVVCCHTCYHMGSALMFDGCEMSVSSHVK